MNPALGPELKQHFDELADEAPPAPDTLVPTARIRGDRHHRRQAVMGAAAGAVALALTVGLGVTQPWSRSTDAPAASPGNGVSPTHSTTAGANDPHLASASWRLLRQPAGGFEVEYYDTTESIFAAAPLLVRGAVTDVELGPVVDDPQVDQPYRDILLTITPSNTAGPAAAATGPIVVQLGPLFGTEAGEWVQQMSTGAASLIGDEAVWALRPREDAPTYRPLTGYSVFVRNGDGVLTSLAAAQTPISQEIKSTSWSHLVAAAGLSG